MGFKARKPHPAFYWPEVEIYVNGRHFCRDFKDFSIHHHRRSGTFIRFAAAPVRVDPDNPPEILLVKDTSFGAEEIEIPFKGNWQTLYIPEGV